MVVVSKKYKQIWFRYTGSAADKTHKN